MAGITLGAILATIPNYVCYVIGLILIMSFNDLSTMILTELQASITTTSNHSVIGPFGQINRRCLNTVSALTGPIFFGILPCLPYIVTSCITLVWVVILYTAFAHRIKTSSSIIGKGIGGRARSLIKKDDSSFQKMEEIREILKHGECEKKDQVAEVLKDEKLAVV